MSNTTNAPSAWVVVRDTDKAFATERGGFSRNVHKARKMRDRQEARAFKFSMRQIALTHIEEVS